MALHRLPNGKWLTLTKITGISPAETYGVDYTTVFIKCDDGSGAAVKFDTYAHAEEWADHLAALVNAAAAIKDKSE